jgi:hypothetical protein
MHLIQDRPMGADDILTILSGADEPANIVNRAELDRKPYARKGHGRSI